MFASPERALLFDINDFDESYPGPWEWDVKRLAASLVVAGRENGFTDKQTRQDRRRRGTTLSRRHVLASPTWATSPCGTPGSMSPKRNGSSPPSSTRRSESGWTSRCEGTSPDHLRSLDKLTEVVDGRRRIIADPPLVVPVSQLAPGMRRDEVESTVEGILLGYGSSLDPGHRGLVGSYTFVDMARKVVGVGSVGTRCWIVLMRGRDDDDPLFLQVKEAQAVGAGRSPGRQPVCHRGRTSGGRPADHAGGR